MEVEVHLGGVAGLVVEGGSDGLVGSISGKRRNKHPSLLLP